LLLLAFLAEDLFAQIHDALALVWLRPAIAADLGCHLADALLVGTGDQDRGRLFAFDLDISWNWIVDVMAVSELQHQGLTLHGGTIADAADVEGLAIALGDAGQHVAHQIAGRAPHDARLLGRAPLLHPNLIILELHLNLAGDRHRQFAQLALGLEQAGRDRNIHAARHVDGVLAYS